MPTGNSNGMTAKTAINVLRGTVSSIRAQAKLDALAASRLARASGGNPTVASKNVLAASERVINALHYGEAAVATFSKTGKSALKAAAAISYTPGKSPIPASPSRSRSTPAPRSGSYRSW